MLKLVHKNRLLKFKSNFNNNKIKPCAYISYLNNTTRCYHSYPDPDEKPIINMTKSDFQKTIISKDTSEYKLDPKFKLDKLFPGTILSKGIDSSLPPATFTTKLDNGLIVASQEMPGMMTAFALIIRAGSAYEEQSGLHSNLGATQFLELNAFRSTNKRSYQQLIEELELLGGMVQCISSRENIIYVMDVMHHQAEQALDILADTILNPLLPEEELEESRDIVRLQQQELPSEVFSRDLLQRAAYIGSPLSNHHYCPIENVNDVNASMIQDFRLKHYFGENCIMSVAGMEHQAAVELVKKKFSHLPHGIRQRDGLDKIRLSTYTGGMLVQERELKEPFVKLAMGFEVGGEGGGGWSDPLLVPTCVLQQILGGGSSFSAGGPGKGMFSRLYTQVLNRYYWAESVESFLSIHENSGIVGIDGACPPEKLIEMIQVIVDQFTNLALIPVSDEELSRAKNMLKSSMMMQLESRLVQCEDIARQFITYGKRDSTNMMCTKIDEVTPKDIMLVASRMLNSPPSIGVVGHDVSKIPPYDAIKQYCKEYYSQAKDKGLYKVK